MTGYVNEWMNASSNSDCNYHEWIDFFFYWDPSLDIVEKVRHTHTVIILPRIITILVSVQIEPHKPP